MKVNFKKLFILLILVLVSLIILGIVALLVALTTKEGQFAVLRLQNEKIERSIKIGHYKEFIEKYPKYIDPRLKLATYYIRQYYVKQGNLTPEEEKYLDLAIGEYNSVLEIDPKNEQALLGLSDVYTMEGNIEKAIEVNKKLIDLEPENPSYHVKLGFNYFSQNKSDEVLEEAKKAIRYDPADIRAHLLVATVYEVEQNAPGAIEELKDAVRIIESLKKERLASGIYRKLGSIYMRVGLVYNATEQFEKAVKADPDSLQAHIELAAAYQKAGLDNKCIDTLLNSPLFAPLKAGVKLPPQQKVQGYMLLATSYLRNGDFIAALAYFKKIEAFGINLKKDFMEKLEEAAQMQQARKTTENPPEGVASIENEKF